MIDTDLVRQLNKLNQQVDNLVKPEIPPFSVTPFSGLNPIINGAMNIDQREGPYTSVANDDYTLDRWRYGKSGTMVHDVSQVVGSPTSSIPFSHYMLIDCTTADASIAAGDFTIMEYRMEGYDWTPFAAIDGFWLTFWVNPPITGTYCVSFRNSGADRSYVVEYTATAGIWQEIEVFVSTSPTAGTWNYTNGIGLRISFALAAGSTFQTTAGAWQTGNFLATSNQVNAVNSVANNFQLSNVKLSKKSTDYTAPSYQQELARAQRYYWRCANELVGYGYANSTSNVRATLFTPVEMRATPTINAAGFTTFRGNATSINITGVNVLRKYASGVTTDLAGTGLTVNQFYAVNGGATPLEFSAEL